MIEVRCCRPCNGGMSLDDEAFRVFASALFGRSPAGDWIWDNRVVGSSFVRSPRLKQNVLKAIQQVTLEAGGKKMAVSALTIPNARAKKFLIRMTKGLIRAFYPEKTWARTMFEVAQLELSQENIDLCHTAMEKYESRGDRVFRFWMNMHEGISATGQCVLAFYDASLWEISLVEAS